MNVRLGACALFLGLTAAAVAPALADDVIIYGAHEVPAYTVWQPGWDRHEYDRHHVILGTVVHFSPYRLQLARRNGVVQQIDLKNGTVIFPTGATPSPSQRVAIVGYYSRGTFIANRVLLHN